ncbi:MAG: hypothetical protein FWF10_01485 [Clostridiales bacterium]|nr:hypothetical protein [Clostridiales bacterium]
MKEHFTSKQFYFLSLGSILLLCFYPLWMGVQILSAYIRDGYVHATDYPKYVIPYTPIAIALILAVALLPLAVKLCKRLALPVISVFGVGMFLLTEMLFEQVTVFSLQEGAANIGSFQAFLCIATPQVMQTIEFRETIGEALAARYSPVFKLHFYLIAILIVLAVIGVVHGFGKMIREQNYEKRKPLLLQSAAVTAFIGLCIFACFTAFYRTGEITVAPVSAWLMGIFFIVFGLTAGVYTGSLLYFKKPLFSRALPALVAAATTILMYIGELVMMGGELFRFGSGPFFASIGACAFAPMDWVVVLLSGVITYLLLFLVRHPTLQFACK